MRKDFVKGRERGGQLTFRTSSPSSTLCLNGPIMTSRISSGLMTDSRSTNGIRLPMCGRIRSGLLCAAELSAVIDSRRISMSSSCSIVYSMSTSTPRSTPSNASSLSGRV